ncbi:MAG: sulfurtransferase TusA family protein [Aminivibrio sp.]|jgi:tRNA 2-thiouridine synthesizing protein A|nr:sulfurtransferase TusA family protein [Aminivibrio sp.]
MSEAFVVDARGLSCPQPVIETRKALEKHSGGPVEVLVDTVTSRENVSRYGASHGWKVAKEETGDGFKVTFTR